jgi:hypothetical protein
VCWSVETRTGRLGRHNSNLRIPKLPYPGYSSPRDALENVGFQFLSLRQSIRCPIFSTGHECQTFPIKTGLCTENRFCNIADERPRCSAAKGGHQSSPSSTRSSCGPRAPGTVSISPLPSRCEEPLSVVRIRCRTSWSRAPPRQSSFSADGSFVSQSAVAAKTDRELDQAEARKSWNRESITINMPTAIINARAGMCLTAHPPNGAASTPPPLASRNPERNPSGAVQPASVREPASVLGHNL